MGEDQRAVGQRQLLVRIGMDVATRDAKCPECARSET